MLDKCKSLHEQFLLCIIYNYNFDDYYCKSCYQEFDADIKLAFEYITDFNIYTFFSVRIKLFFMILLIQFFMLSIELTPTKIHHNCEFLYFDCCLNFHFFKFV